MKNLIILILLASLCGNASAELECVLIDEEYAEQDIADACDDPNDTQVASADPMPWANDGLGCITDSECEGINEEEAE